MTVLNTLNTLVESELIKFLTPVKTKHGVKIGSVEVVVNRNSRSKSVFFKNKPIFKKINYNGSALSIARDINNQGHITSHVWSIFEIDSALYKSKTDFFVLEEQYKNAMNNKQYDKADILMSKIIQKQTRINLLKNRLTQLCLNTKGNMYENL